MIGLGYVGLPLAKRACEVGLKVAGLDLGESTVTGLMNGSSHVDDLSDADIQHMLDVGFMATTDPTILSRSKVIVICVPTPLGSGGSPDLDAMMQASETVAAHVTTGTLVSLESTTSPGTTDEVLVPLIQAQGHKVGSDVFVVFSPERIDPGNKKFKLQNTPKIVGGSTPCCTERGEEFYSQIVDRVVTVSGTREAEMTKLLENTYRHVNIALMNELSKFCHDLGIDIWEVIAGASTKPFGFQSFAPGPGVGGHCIPIDPNYLAYTVKAKLGLPFRLIELAQEVNAGMPEYVVRRAQEILNFQGLALKGARIVLLGITYKANISDQRQSPARDIGLRLLNSGVNLQFCDPFHTEWTVDCVDGSTSVPSVGADDVLSSLPDLVLVLQHHDAFDLERLAASGAKVLDTRGLMTATTNVSRL